MPHYSLPLNPYILVAHSHAAQRRALIDELRRSGFQNTLSAVDFGMARWLLARDSYSLVVGDMFNEPVGLALHTWAMRPATAFAVLGSPNMDTAAVRKALLEGGTWDLMGGWPTGSLDAVALAVEAAIELIRPRAHVLLIEPDEAALFLHLLFRQEGYAIDVAASGVAAMEHLRTRRYDLVIFEYHVWHGSTLLAHLRERYRSLPLLIHSASGGEPSLVNDFYQMGAWEVLPKPTNIDLLLERAAALVTRGLAAKK